MPDRRIMRSVPERSRELAREICRWRWSCWPPYAVHRACWALTCGNGGRCANSASRLGDRADEAKNEVRLGLDDYECRCPCEFDATRWSDRRVAYER